MPRIRFLLLAALLGIVGALVPVSAPAMSLPTTLAASQDIGRLEGGSRIVEPAFPVEYLGASWLTGRPPLVRFDVDGRWTGWRGIHRDEDLPSDGGRTYAELIPTRDADAFQLRGRATGVRTVAINTTDGQRHLTWVTPAAQASHLSEPQVISRAQWGADESYRFDGSGHEVWPPAFYPTQKLIVHHTAGSNSDTQDFAATVRAIYYYHAVTRGYGDIGYNFLIDRGGTVYKGRWSGPAGSTDQGQDSATGENADGYGVTAAHTGGFNSGTVGVAIMGTYSTVDIPQAARSSLVDLLAWESDHHGLDSLGSSTYTNPVNGTQKYAPNISGHRDWVATECPGDVLYAELPSIRQEVAAKVAGAPPQSRTYAASSTTVVKGQAVSGMASDLATDDQRYFTVAGAKEKKKFVSSWYGQATVDASGVTGLTVSYDGSSTVSATQTLSIYDFQAGSWQQVSQAAVGSTDRTVNWSTSTPARYMSSSGQVRLRVFSTATSAADSRGDLMAFTVTY